MENLKIKRECLNLKKLKIIFRLKGDNYERL